MAIHDVFWGEQSWNDYISAKDQVEGFRETIKGQTNALIKSQNKSAMQIRLNQRDYNLALESGFGAVGNHLDSMSDAFSSELGGLSDNIELGFDQLSRGIDQLNADFNLLMGDVIWRLEMQDRSLQSILETLQAPLDTQAKELRHRAEDAYQNGWYEESLSDFLESEKKNYQDFSVHRSIGNIYLYHLIDLSKALEYFQKASKYANPRDSRQAAEAEYFAGITCAAKQNIKEAFQHLQNATSLNSHFYEAFYMKACFASMLENIDEVLNNLRIAIDGDGRYFERASKDNIFNNYRSDVNILLNQYYKKIQDEAKTVGERIIFQYDKFIPSLRPNDREKFNSVLESIKELTEHEKSYLQYRKFVKEERLFYDELQKAIKRKDAFDKRQAEEEDNLRKQKEKERQASQEKIRKEQVEKEKRNREATKKMWRTVGTTFLISFISYFVTGIGGCLVMFSKRGVENEMAGFKFWLGGAFVVPAIILFGGILVAIVERMSKK